MLNRILEILVVDDHDLIRRGAVDLLSTLADGVSIDDVATLAEAEKLLREKGSYDLVVLDLMLPNVTDFEGLVLLKSISPQTPIAIVSGIVELKTMRAAFDCGADGYISKSSPADVMLQAVRLILQGELYIPSMYLRATSIGQSDKCESNEKLESSVSNLTARQTEVLELIQRGHSNKEIAMQLGCAESTVKTHVSSILSAAGVATRGKLIAANTAKKNPDSWFSVAMPLAAAAVADVFSRDLAGRMPDISVSRPAWEQYDEHPPK